MPTSPRKRRPSAFGRLGRLLTSLRPPARAGPLPVQTGFPTSLADLIVKNHVRLRNPRRRHHVHHSTVDPPSPAPPIAEESPPPPQQEQRRCEVLTAQENAAAAVVREKGAAFTTIRPEGLAVGGAVALALLVIWSKWLVAAATAASVALFFVESAMSSASRSRPGTEAPDCVRAAESDAGTPRSSCADSDDTGSEASSSSSSSLGATDDDSPTDPKRKEKRRSLRNLIAKRLRNGKRCKDTDTAATAPLHGGESRHPDAEQPVVKVHEMPGETEPTDAMAVERCRKAGAFPSAALVPTILVGLLLAGKLPAVALTVLCAIFFTRIDSVPAS